MIRPGATSLIMRVDTDSTPLPSIEGDPSIPVDGETRTAVAESALPRSRIWRAPFCTLHSRPRDRHTCVISRAADPDSTVPFEKGEVFSADLNFATAWL